jgi:nitrogen fixation NifU-like protein
MYNEVVMDHFKNPRNVGVIDNPDGVGEVGNPLCGDMMTIYLKIKDNQIDDIKFQTFVRLCDCRIEHAHGNAKEDRGRGQADHQDVANALQGLPKNKLHCSNLGADALHIAIKNYEDARRGCPGQARQRRA